MPSRIVSGFKFKKDVGKKEVAKAKAQIRSYAISSFQRTLQRVVDVFESDIVMETKTKTTGDVFTVTVQARPGIFTDSRVSNSPLETAKLFEYLNSGTDERKVYMPPDYQRSSSPNSLTTRLTDNDRGKIGFAKTPLAGIQARNWTRLITAERAIYTKRLLERITGTLVSRTLQG